MKTLGNGRTDDLAFTPDGRRLITARAGSGDNLNATTHSSWLCVTFTN